MKKLTSLALALILVVQFVPAFNKTAGSTGASLPWDGSIATSYAGGRGYPSDPFQIATGAQLALMAQDLQSTFIVPDYYILINDIDLGNHEWTPINTSWAHFNGNNFTIRNLKVTNGQISPFGAMAPFSLFVGSALPVSGSAMDVYTEEERMEQVKAQMLLIESMMEDGGSKPDTGGFRTVQHSARPSLNNRIADALYVEDTPA